MAKLYTLLVALVLPLAAAAQSKFFDTVDEARRGADAVAAAAARGDTPEALRQLRQFSSISPRDFGAVQEQIVAGVARVRERYGEPIGWELVREEKAGSALVRLTYLIRHDWAGQRWMFIFYRGKEGWAVTDFTIDGSLGTLFP